MIGLLSTGFRKWLGSLSLTRPRFVLPFHLIIYELFSDRARRHSSHQKVLRDRYLGGGHRGSAPSGHRVAGAALRPEKHQNQGVRVGGVKMYIVNFDFFDLENSRFGVWGAPCGLLRGFPFHPPFPLSESRSPRSIREVSIQLLGVSARTENCSSSK